MLDDNYSLNDDYSTKIICQKSLALHNRLMERSRADSQKKYECHASRFQFAARKKRENLFGEENFTEEKIHIFIELKLANSTTYICITKNKKTLQSL